MTGTTLPRSFLFVPGDSERKYESALASAADAVILDLEDSVHRARKSEARSLVATWLACRPGSAPSHYVRVNAPNSGQLLADLVAVIPGRPDGIVIPKLERNDEMERIDAYLSALELAAGLPDGGTALLPIVTESAAALLGLAQLRAGPRAIGFTWGGEDLAADIGAARNMDEAGNYLPTFVLAREQCLLAATRNRVPAIDAVCTAFRDQVRLERECHAARAGGFLGKLAIHPSQLDTINRIFSADPDEMRWAGRVVEAFAAGVGVATLDGMMLDEPHLRRAKALLRRSRTAAEPAAISAI